jgi:hypothetical protein
MWHHICMMHSPETTFIHLSNTSPYYSNSFCILESNFYQNYRTFCIPNIITTHPLICYCGTCRMQRIGDLVFNLSPMTFLLPFFTNLGLEFKFSFTIQLSFFCTRPIVFIKGLGYYFIHFSLFLCYLYFACYSSTHTHRLII